VQQLLEELIEALQAQTAAINELVKTNQTIIEIVIDDAGDGGDDTIETVSLDTYLDGSTGRR
tara:strand:+ start:3989 stop:4174 length:186 start_codon:yes stop_codon:yes gene_type:complete